MRLQTMSDYKLSAGKTNRSLCFSSGAGSPRGPHRFGTVLLQRWPDQPCMCARRYSQCSTGCASSGYSSIDRIAVTSIAGPKGEGGLDDATGASKSAGGGASMKQTSRVVNLGMPVGIKAPCNANRRCAADPSLSYFVGQVTLREVMKEMLLGWASASPGRRRRSRRISFPKFFVIVSTLSKPHSNTLNPHWRCQLFA